MAIFSIPNRPTGASTRNINDLMGNFDALVSQIHAGLGSTNLNGRVIDEGMLSEVTEKKVGVGSGRDIFSDASEVIGGPSMGDAEVQVEVVNPAFLLALASVELKAIGGGSTVSLRLWGGLSHHNKSNKALIGTSYASASFVDYDIVLPGTHVYELVYTNLGGTFGARNRMLSLRAFEIV